MNDEFGHSGPAWELLRQFGLCADHIAEVARGFCEKVKRLPLTDDRENAAYRHSRGLSGLLLALFIRVIMMAVMILFFLYSL
ncbi:MAG: hypothetical protein ACLUN5_18995 [Oscillospiraceae bacterium]